MKSEVKLVAGIGLAALIGGIIASQLEKSAVQEGMRKARDELFEVSPGCTQISFKGGSGAPDPSKLAMADRYYFGPFVSERLNDAGRAEAEILGVSMTDFLTAKVLYDLFPECKESMPWPPESIFTAGTFGLIWVGMRSHMAELIAAREGNA